MGQNTKKVASDKWENFHLLGKILGQLGKILKQIELMKETPWLPVKTHRLRQQIGREKTFKHNGADPPGSDTLIVEVKELLHRQADEKESLRRRPSLLGGTVRSLHMRSVVILP